MMRVYEEFAERAKQAANERGITVADFCEQFLIPCVDRAHREYITTEAKKLAGGGKDGA